MAAAERISAAMSDLAAVEIGSASDLDELGLALAQYAEDQVYMWRRLADRVAGTALHWRVLDHFMAAGDRYSHVSDYVQEHLAHPLVTRRP